MKKIVSFVISICMMISGFSAFAEKPTYNDIQNHWAKDVIENWSSYEIINGYEGNFLPDKSITRGEFATIINRIFNFDEPSQNTFDDLDENYYTNHILCLNNQGIMTGFENNIRPNDYITREEAGAILYKALKLKEYEALPESFHDENEISDWAKPYMLSLVNEGYFNGYNGYLRPKDNITRAEAITLLDNGIAIINESIDKGEFEKVCIVNSDNLTLNDCVFQNDVFVTSNVTTLIMENVSANETLYVFSASDKCVALKNCMINDMDVIHEESVYIEPLQEDEANNDSDIETEDDFADDSSGSSEGEWGSNTEGSSGGSSSGSSNNGLDEDSQDSPSNDSDENSKDESEDNDAENDDSLNPDDENNDEDSEKIEIPEELKPTIETTLQDGLLQKNSKKVFDVIAKDVSGNKIDCKVRCNDINIEPSWDDETKTSFTLEFQDSGEYVVEITATDYDGISQTKTYNITYEMAEYGEPIGKATVCIEAFTIGGGYIVAPIEIDVLEGVNCAYLLDEFLADNNLSYMSTGSLDGGFYLATISDVPEFTPVICETLLSALTDAGFDVQLESYTPNELSEFDFTQGSGWMYCVNGVFPNVGFSEYYLQDGDVMRIQFTLAYGSDIGGASGAGYAYAGDFYEMVNRDELTKIIANIGVENCQEYMELISKPDLTEDELSDLLNQLR